MGNNKFSKIGAIKFGWEIFKKRPWFLVGVTLVYWLFNYFLQTLTGQLTELNMSLGILFNVIYLCVSVLLITGWTKITLRYADGEQASFSELFYQYHLFVKVTLSSILYFLIVFFGTILLIVPGIIWSMKYQFYIYFIIDKGVGPIEAFKMSANITKGYKWELFLFFLLWICVNLLGVMALGVGLLVTMPVTMIATAYIYRKLSAVDLEEKIAEEVTTEEVS